MSDKNLKEVDSTETKLDPRIKPPINFAATIKVPVEEIKMITSSLQKEKEDEYERDYNNKVFNLRLTRFFLLSTFAFFALFFIGINSSFLIKKIIMFASLGGCVISFILFMIFLIKYFSKKTIKLPGKVWFFNSISGLLCVCCVAGLTILYGPFSGFRDWLITTAMGTMTHQYLCKIFYSDKTIASVLDDNFIEDTEEEPDTSLVIVPEEVMDDDPNWTEYERAMFEGHTKSEIYRMIKFTVRGQRAFLAVIYDPANLRVECAEKVMHKGEYVTSMAQRTNALVAINGGRFYDPGHQSNGGIPSGVTISNGKIISNRSYSSPMGVIAITNDNKLALYKNKSAKQLVKLGVRDAVTSKPFLIINGKALYTKGNGGYGYDARTAIGQRADGVMLLLVVEANDSRTNGASMKELTKVFQDYGAINAAALDGGTSSVMVEKGLLISDPINTPFVHQTRKIATSFIVTEPSFNALTGIDGEETFEEENIDGLDE